MFFLTLRYPLELVYKKVCLFSTFIINDGTIVILSYYSIRFNHIHFYFQMLSLPRSTDYEPKVVHLPKILCFKTKLHHPTTSPLQSLTCLDCYFTFSQLSSFWTIWHLNTDYIISFSYTYCLMSYCGMLVGVPPFSLNYIETAN